MESGDFPHVTLLVLAVWPSPVNSGLKTPDLVKSRNEEHGFIVKQQQSDTEFEMIVVATCDKALMYFPVKTV